MRERAFENFAVSTTTVPVI